MSHAIVIFGASGDLTSRKLIPALYNLHRKNRLPSDVRIVGFSRTKYSDDAWREDLAATTREFAGPSFDEATWNEFASSIHYQPGDLQSAEDVAQLDSRLSELESGDVRERLYYLSTAPRFYEPAIENLGAADMANEDAGPRRIIIEKPFGTDLTTARALNRSVHQVFQEHQVYRIDHYLGKETVQNLLVLRFANSIFEPLWNRNYIDHVQITVAEEVAVGSRGDYYNSAGVLRDMFQNHLLQLLMVTAMEAPVAFEADAVRDEKVKVLRAIRPMDECDVFASTVRGQYDGYLDEPGVPNDSQAATFAALRLSVDSWRWQGVPFYLRSGKAMSCRTTQIMIQFRQPPFMMFDPDGTRDHEANRLLIQIQPAEGIQLHFLSKVPDSRMQLAMTDLDFRFRQEFGSDLPDAYQPLLLDALQGDASNFARADEVESSWSIIDPIQHAWESGQGPAVANYPKGQWGPTVSNDWIEAQGRQWFDTCPVIHEPGTH